MGFSQLKNPFRGFHILPSFYSTRGSPANLEAPTSPAATSHFTTNKPARTATQGFAHRCSPPEPSSAIMSRSLFLSLITRDREIVLSFVDRLLGELGLRTSQGATGVTGHRQGGCRSLCQRPLSFFAREQGNSFPLL